MEREELMAILNRYPYLPLSYWGQGETKSIGDLKQEIDDGEVELTVLNPEFAQNGVAGLVRKIHTVLITTYVDLPQEDGPPERMVLIELKRQKGHLWLPRRMGKESLHLSEKIRYLRNPPESPEETVLRLFIEELDLRHRDTDKLISLLEVRQRLRFDTHQPPPEITGSKRFPGLITHNTMLRGEIVLDYAYYRPEYKEHEAGTGRLLGVFRWQGTAPDSEPIPELIG